MEWIPRLNDLKQRNDQERQESYKVNTSIKQTGISSQHMESKDDVEYSDERPKHVDVMEYNECVQLNVGERYQDDDVTDQSHAFEYLDIEKACYKERQDANALDQLKVKATDEVDQKKSDQDAYA